MQFNLALDDNGELIYLDDDGNRDFSPGTVHVIQLVSAAFLSAALLLAVLIATGLMPPMPWSPMGQSTPTQVEVPVVPVPPVPGPDFGLEQQEPSQSV